MNALPIGFYTGLLAISTLTALVSGIYTLLRLRNVARWTNRPGNDVEPGPKQRLGGRQTGGTRITLVICTIATCISFGLLALIASGVIGSEQTANDPTVQRP